MEEKYELLARRNVVITYLDENEYKTIERPLYQIRATRDMILIETPRGSLGGFIENQSSLSREGDCWIDTETFVIDNAKVTGDSYVENSIIMDNAVIDLVNNGEGNHTLRDTIVGGDTIVTNKQCSR